MMHSTIHYSGEVILPQITQREKEILLLLCEGCSSKEVAAYLHISHHTVETHKRNLVCKLNARNLVHLAVLAERYGLCITIQSEQVSN